jgi:hypothetical protein
VGSRVKAGVVGCSAMSMAGSSNGEMRAVAGEAERRWTVLKPQELPEIRVVQLVPLKTSHTLHPTLVYTTTAQKSSGITIAQHRSFNLSIGRFGTSLNKPVNESVIVDKHQDICTISRYSI